MARWEEKQFKNRITSFPANIVVSIVDFVENYSFQVQNEVQSMHWHTYRILILVHICFHCNLTWPDPYGFSSNTTSTFLMIRNMILNLFNIVSKCNGNIWWNMGMHHNVIGCGMMVSHLNSRITSLGILCQGILTWSKVAEWFGVYLVVAMVRVLMMG